MDVMGFDWPFSPLWLWGSVVLIGGAILWHGRFLFVATTRRNAWQFLGLRMVFALLLLFLIARPFTETSEPDLSSIRFVSLVDLSGSMNERDDAESDRRLAQVRPHLDLGVENSWINQMRNSYGLVQRLGFSGDDVFSLRRNSWTLPEEGSSSAIGSALQYILESEHPLPLAGVTLFSDGRNNHRESPLEIASLFLEAGIPVNVIGVGEDREQGNLSVRFVNVPTQIKAKEELVLVGEITNSFTSSKSSVVRLVEEENFLEEVAFTLSPGESRMVKFSPLFPEQAGRINYRLLLDASEGDNNPTDDSANQVVMIQEPDLFSTLYISNQVQPLYPFIKRSLSGERFQLSALIRLGKETFHARGETLSSQNYPTDPEFWMEYDAIILDLSCLNELNASLVSSLKQYVEKRGGGLLTFGSPVGVRDKLGGVFPAVEFEELRTKQSLSLDVLPDPVFTNAKNVNKWKTFLPANMPVFLVSEKNPAALSVAGLKSNFNRSALVLQAYGSGKSAYWGSSHDWKRALINEDRAKEFSIFWQGLVEWLGSGEVERVRLPLQDQPIARGEKASLALDVLGADFEPSLDAMVEANISGPDDFSQRLQLYPRSGRAGSYYGEFLPPAAGSYRVSYRIYFPSGEDLEDNTYMRVEKHGMEAKDTRYAERDLRMLANLTGGKFTHVSDLRSDWRPKVSQTVPTMERRNDLANSWIILIILLFTGGLEWIWRRKEGLR